VLGLFFVGPAGRSQLDSRLEQTVMQEESLPARVTVWADSMSILRDFPLLGVGLSAWPEAFPRYRRPPWSRILYTETHNNYLQLLTETGLLGFGLLTWFFWLAGRRLYQGLWTVSLHVFPVCAALTAALGIMAFHEFFDFNLQIPANAFLFTLLLAVALRLTRSGVPRAKDQGPRTKGQVQDRFRTPALLSGGVVAATLCVLALRQESLPYPYNVEEPASLAETRELLDLYPAHASLHRSLVFFIQDHTAPSEWLKELESALWLNPRDPYTRDLYALVLESQGREEEGLQEITRSVTFAPSRTVHLYLSDRLISSLSERKKQAVEEGFKQALASGYDGAVAGLGGFYAALGRFPEEGKLYEETARQVQDFDEQVSYLLKAGLAYARAGEMEKAETLLRQITHIAPQDPRAYQYLATRVFAPKGEVALAKAVVSEGKKMGVDALSLSLSLAEAAQKAGDLQEAKTALQEALSLQPSSFDANFRLGQVYLQEKNFDRATLALRKATKLRPDEALVFYYLGVAEERRYQFSAAQQAYARAVELEPDNSDFQERYQAFQRKVAGNTEKKG
jgi:tetratricopeptide (TPR) repeat protein